MKKITDKIIFIPNFIINTTTLFNQLVANVEWDKNMKSRKTA